MNVNSRSLLAGTMRDVYVAGVGMTDFGKFADRDSKNLADEAVTSALLDGGATPGEIEAAFVGNAVAGLITGQEMIRGQVVLNALGLSGIPIINVENACASGSTGFHLAWQQVATGIHDVVLALGVEKMTHEDKTVSFEAINTAVDLDKRSLMSEALGTGGQDRSFFMDIYASMGRDLMERTGLTQRHLALVAEKAHTHAMKNPRAQYRDSVSVEDVLASREIVWPLTLLMCSPIGDGAAAAILASEDGLRRFSAGENRPRARVLTSVLRSGRLPSDEEQQKSVATAAKQAYEEAGLGPVDVDLAEVHDATAPAEIMLYEDLGFFETEELAAVLVDGKTRITGTLPVNTSGGLLCKGHPIGATGVAQIVELTEQLEGRAGPRQIENATVALAQNGGGWLGDDSAAAVVTILARN